MDQTTSHKPTIRVEDDYLLRGTGRYMADAPLPGQTYACFVRSPHAFATVKSIDTKPALAIKGVVAVITMDDVKAAEVKNLSQHPPVAGRNGGKLIMPVRPALAGEKVRHVGEPVAMVLGETYAAAQDGAEAVEVDYEAHDAVIDLREAMKPGAPQVWPEAPGNIAVDWAGLAANPDEMAAKVDAAMKSAAHVAKVSLVHQRINVASMEPRGGTASHDKANDSYLLRVCSQGARAMRDAMAGVMGIPPAKIRVTTEEVGGAFGLKTGPYPEYVAMLVGAKKIGRPVHWMSGRNESFVSDNHARDAYSDVELALDANGKFLAFRLRHYGSLGAYVGAVGANIHTANMTRCLPGMYDIKLMDVQAKCVFTHTTPTAPYRGAGRPEASYCLERVVDEAARVTGIDPIRLRKKNLISKKAMPYKTSIGTTYDSGDFATVVDKGLELADYDGLQGAQEGVEEERPAARARRLLRAGAFRRRADRGHAGVVPRRRQDDVHHERAVHRPEPRHDLPAHGRRTPRHQGRAGRPRPRRQRTRDRGLCLGRLAHRDDRGPRHGEDARGDARQGQEGRGGGAGSRRRRHRIQERRVQRGRHRPPHVAVRRGGARQGHEEEGRDRGRPRHQGRHRHAAHLPQRLPHRRGRGRSRRPACRSSRPIRRWTTAATSSTTPSSRARCTARSPWASARR